MRLLFNFMIFVVVGLTTGFGSALYMLDQGTSLTTLRAGPWLVWSQAGRADADPYTRAKLARSGELLITSASVKYFTARTATNGEIIDARCTYSIKGTGPLAHWWTLAAYDQNGDLMANQAARHSFSSETVMRNNRGAYEITLSPMPASGNWLPVSADYRVILMMRVHQPDVLSETTDEETAKALFDLPTIERKSC
ncbi:MAG: DUF1214 domain-containing protein [Pseudomonadota bacterium]